MPSWRVDISGRKVGDEALEMTYFQIRRLFVQRGKHGSLTLTWGPEIMMDDDDSLSVLPVAWNLSSSPRASAPAPSHTSTLFCCPGSMHFSPFVFFSVQHMPRSLPAKHSSSSPTWDSSCMSNPLIPTLGSYVFLLWHLTMNCNYFICELTWILRSLSVDERL